MCLGNNLLVRRKTRSNLWRYWNQMFALFPAASTFRVSLVLLTVLLRPNNVRGTRFPFTLSSGPSLVKARICARDPVQQHFFCVPYGVSTEAHVWYAYRTGTYQFTQLYDCKSYILNSIYKLLTENDFVFIYINYHLFSCRLLNDNELKTLPSGIFSDLSSLWYL